MEVWKSVSTCKLLQRIEASFFALLLDPLFRNLPWLLDFFSPPDPAFWVDFSGVFVGCRAAWRNPQQAPPKMGLRQGRSALAFGFHRGEAVVEFLLVLNSAFSPSLPAGLGAARGPDEEGG